MLQLRFKNIGEGLAVGVEVELKKGFNQFGKNEYSLSEVGLIRNGFNIFPPGYELKYYLDSAIDIFKEYPEEHISMTIKYRSADGVKFKFEYNLPFNQVLGQNYSSPPDNYIDRIPFFLKEINTTLNQLRRDITDNFSSLNNE